MRRLLAGFLMVLALVSGGVRAELITDGATWKLGGGFADYLAAVYGDYTNMTKSIKEENISMGFQALYVGENAPHGPYGWQFNFISPEIANAPAGTKVRLKIRITPYSERYVNATTDGYRYAEITNENNSQETIDWLITNLKRPITEVGVLEITIPVRELGIKTVTGPYGRQIVRDDNLQERHYTFGLRRAKETLEQAKANWEKKVIK